MSSQSVLKYGSLAVMLVGYTLDTVLVKRATYAAYYPSALTLLAALLGVLVYPLIVACALATGKVTWVQVTIRRRHWWRPLAIGAGFSLHHVLLNVSGGKSSVPGIWILVLGKSIVPMSMLLNMLPKTMDLRYDRFHWLGVVFLLSGVVLTLHHDLYKTALSAKGFSAQIGNIVLIVLAQLPMAASFTFIEVSLKGVMSELFTVALWMWICIFQALASLVLLPLNAALAGKASGGSHHQGMLGNLGDGVWCYVLGQTSVEAPEGTDCTIASFMWWFSILAAFSMNLAMPVSTRYGGAALMWFVRALAIPLTGMLFASPFLMGHYAKYLTFAQVMGLATVAIGVLIFNSREPHNREACSADARGELSFACMGENGSSSTAAGRNVTSGDTLAVDVRSLS